MVRAESRWVDETVIQIGSDCSVEFDDSARITVSEGVFNLLPVSDELD